MLTAMGVREFDLLQVVPFGRAFTDGRDTLFYDLDEMRPLPPGGARLLEAARRPHLAEPLPAAAPRGLRAPHPGSVQAQRRGARAEGGVRAPPRRGHLARLPRARALPVLLPRAPVRHARGRADARDTRGFDVVRVDTEWEAKQPPVFGGDPASAKKSKEATRGEDGKRRLPLAGTVRAPAASRSRRSSLRRRRERCTSQLRICRARPRRSPAFRRSRGSSCAWRLRRAAPGVARWRIGPARGPIRHARRGAYGRPGDGALGDRRGLRGLRGSHQGDGGLALRRSP